MTPAEVTTFARAELEHRRAALNQAIANRQRTRAQAETTYKLWLAIACAAGVDDVPELEPYADGARPQPFEFARRADWTVELARARDVALERSAEPDATPAHKDRARGLMHLAGRLGRTAIPFIAPYQPRARPAERKAA